MKKLLEIRPITVHEIPDALGIHRQWWGSSPDILTREDLLRLVRKHPEYQLGLFIHGRMVAHISSAAVHTGRVSEGLHLEPTDEMPQHYLETKGVPSKGPLNTQSCFIVSRDQGMSGEEKRIFNDNVRGLFEKQESLPDKINPAQALILKVRQRALRDPRVLYLTAMSTAENLKGKNATLREIEHAIGTARNMKVLHGLAQVWKLKAQGRADAPFGANSLVVMNYPLGKWQSVLKEVMDHLRGLRLRVADSRSRRILKRHGISFSNARQRQGGATEVRVKDRQITLVFPKYESSFPQIEAAIHLANQRHGTNFEIVRGEKKILIREKSEK